MFVNVIVEERVRVHKRISIEQVKHLEELQLAIERGEGEEIKREPMTYRLDTWTVERSSKE